MVEIAAVVFNLSGLGGLRIESPTLVTKKGSEVLPKTAFEVGYIDLKILLSNFNSYKIMIH